MSAVLSRKLLGRQKARAHTGNTKRLETLSVSYVAKIPDDRGF